MGIIALKVIGIVVGLTLLLGLIALVLYLGVALARMAGVTVMQWRDLVSPDRWQEVLSTVGRNKLRTFLTTVSVAWGIFVLVFLLGLGNGLNFGMRKSFARDAANGLWIYANKTSIPYGGYDINRQIQFENADYDRAKKVAGVDLASAQHYIRSPGPLMVRWGVKASSFSIEAVHPATLQLQSHDMVEGRFISRADVMQDRKTAVIGKTVQQFLFDGKPPLGEWISIGSIAFQVVGVFSDAKGAEDERRIYIPVSTAQLAFNGGDDLGQLQLMLGDVDAAGATKIANTIVAQLAEKHDFDPTDKQAARVRNNLENAKRFGQIFWMISTFVVVIGIGTLAAGVVGVSNIMMIAVKERTKEIGVRKALGATPRSIVFMIIQEAIFLTGIAGMLGLAAGVALLELVGKVDNEMIYNPSISFGTGVGATAFLIVAGALAGYFPARAAAKVNPIHALRDS